MVASDCLALHVAGLSHRVCTVIAVLISVAAPKLTGRGLESEVKGKMPLVYSESLNGCIQ